MKKKHLLIMTMVILFMVTTAAHAKIKHAKIKIVELEADFWTITFENKTTWWTSFNVYDQRGDHVYPEFIQEVTALAPDGSTSIIPHIYIWDEFGKMYYQSEDVVDCDSIPSGKWTLIVKDTKGNTLEASDRVNVQCLDPPVVEFPTSGATVGPTPTFKWNKVPGAKYYHVFLYTPGGSPIYTWVIEHMKSVKKNKFKFPLGVLRPNITNYRMLIEARDKEFDSDNRSRSDWIYFSTGNW